MGDPECLAGAAPFMGAAKVGGFVRCSAVRCRALPSHARGPRQGSEQKQTHKKYSAHRVLGYDVVPCTFASQTGQTNSSN